VKIKPSPHRAIRLFRSATGDLLDGFLLVDNLFSSSKSQILTIELPSALSRKSKHLVIYARYGDTPHLSTNEWLLLNMFAESENEIVVVSNSSIDEDEVKKLVEQLEIVVITRKNRGRDFAAFRDAILFREIEDKYSSLLLINNSVLWDCEKLKNIMEAGLMNLETDMIGLTDSFQRTYHLQSYFLYFHGHKWQSFLSNEVSSWKNWHFKRSIVHFGERGLSKRAVKRGLKIGAIFPYSMLLKNASRLDYLDQLIKSEVKLNPTQHFWELLFADSFPGFKISLLETNPARIPRVPKDPRTSC
jgi:hypothetical protein